MSLELFPCSGDLSSRGDHLPGAARWADVGHAAPVLHQGLQSHAAVLGMGVGAKAKATSQWHSGMAVPLKRHPQDQGDGLAFVPTPALSAARQVMSRTPHGTRARFGWTLSSLLAPENLMWLPPAHTCPSSSKSDHAGHGSKERVATGQNVPDC